MSEGNLFDPIFFAITVRAQMADRNLKHRAAAREMRVTPYSLLRILSAVDKLDVEVYLRVKAWVEG